EVLETLERHQLPYMVVGSVASIVYGEPRLTKDMDLVIDILPADAPKFETLFPEEHFYVPPAEVLLDEIARRGQFNLVHPASGLKIDIIVRKNGEHGRAEFSRKQRVPLFPGFDAWIASPEDVIIKKLDFYREGGSEKHLADIRGILANTSVDRAYLDSWVKKLGLGEQFEKI
ncbi:MAG: hypothetical protein ACXVBC_12370, partial [Bdellovibrionota bacterium]